MGEHAIAGVAVRERSRDKPGSTLLWGRDIVRRGEISFVRARYRPLPVTCRELPHRDVHPLPANLDVCCVYLRPVPAEVGL